MSRFTRTRPLILTVLVRAIFYQTRASCTEMKFSYTFLDSMYEYGNHFVCEMTSTIICFPGPYGSRARRALFPAAQWRRGRPIGSFLFRFEETVLVIFKLASPPVVSVCSCVSVGRTTHAVFPYRARLAFTTSGRGRGDPYTRERCYCTTDARARSYVSCTRARIKIYARETATTRPVRSQ